MIELESSGSDYTVEAGFRENSVYSTYTPTIFDSAITLLRMEMIYERIPTFSIAMGW